MKSLSRSDGRSAVAASAYRAGVHLTDERTGLVHDYSRRSGVVSAEILTPDGGPADRAQLWNAVEAAERRKDSRTGREWVLALPEELDAEQRRELARGFALELVRRYGVAVDMAIHEPSKGGDKRNHHAHIFATTRIVSRDESGALVMGEKAAIELSDSKRKKLDAGLKSAADEVTELRQLWERLANDALERGGHEARIDSRSLEAQGIDQEPTQHMGPQATHMARRKEPSERGEINRQVKARNAEREAVAAEIIDLQARREARDREQRAREAEKAQAERQAAAREEADRKRRRAEAAEVEAAREQWEQETRELVERMDDFHVRAEALTQEKLRERLEWARAQTLDSCFMEDHRFPQIVRLCEERDAEEMAWKEKAAAAERRRSEALDAILQWKRQHFFRTVFHSLGIVSEELEELEGAAERASVEVERAAVPFKFSEEKELENLVMTAKSWASSRESDAQREAARLEAVQRMREGMTPEQIERRQEFAQTEEQMRADLLQRAIQAEERHKREMRAEREASSKPQPKPAPRSKPEPQAPVSHTPDSGPSPDF